LEKSKRKVRLLTDTCSLMKLLAAGDKLFASKALQIGDLVVHPVVFNETRKWHKTKKEKYKNELSTLNEVKSTSGIRVSGTLKSINEKTIRLTADEIEKAIGNADIEKISSAMVHGMSLITNDGPMAEIAEILEIEVWTAEQIVIEALECKVLSKSEVESLIKLWASRNEKAPSKKDKGSFQKLGIKC